LYRVDLPERLKELAGQDSTQHLLILLCTAFPSVRILWFNHRDLTHPRAGGAERTCEELSKGFSRLGDHTTLVTGGFNGKNYVEQHDRTTIVRYKGYIGPHLAVPSYLDKNYDVVVDDLGHVVPWFSERLGNIPGVVFFRHLHARTLRGQVPLLAELALKFIERGYPTIYRKWPFVTESDRAVNDLIRLGIKSDRIQKINPGVDIHRFRPGKKTANPTITLLGRLMDYKRPDHVIRAMKKVITHFPDATLTVIGDGPSLGPTRRLVEALGLEKSVLFTGRVSDLEVASNLASSWVNVHAATAEGWGYSIMEASASGVPTVAYNVPGVSEAIQNGKNGILVHDGNVDALAEGLISIVDRPRDLYVTSRKYAEGFDWDITAIKWRTFLKRVSEEHT
jgi:glycosyltransferase involved in cell wall biosynthesis